MKLKKTIKAKGLNIDVPDAIHEIGNINVNPDKLTVDLKHFETEESEESFDLSRLSFALETISEQTKQALEVLKESIIDNEISGHQDYADLVKIKE